MNSVQKAGSGRPGAPMAMALVAYTLLFPVFPVHFISHYPTVWPDMPGHPAYRLTVRESRLSTELLGPSGYQQWWRGFGSEMVPSYIQSGSVLTLHL